MMDDQGHRISVLTDDDIDRIADRVLSRLDHSITREQHRDDHAYVKSERDAKASSSASRQRIVEKIVGGAGTVGLVALVGWVGHSIIQTIAHAVGRVWP